MSEKIDDPRKIVFFDGLCHLCDGFVQFCIKHQGHEKLYFASLQGETAKQLLPASQIADPESIVFLTGGRTYTKSHAVNLILRELSGWPLFLSFLFFLPAYWMNPIYNHVAKNRYKIFGKRDSCRLPSSDDLGLLLS